MAVVSDTTPLNYLVQIGHVDLLPELFNQVLIPRAVAAELSVGEAPEVVRRWVGNLPPWVEVRDVAVPTDNSILRLHPGEREAIVLARSLALPLIIDERAGRQVGKLRGVTVVGTLRILDEGAERGLLEFAASLSLLRSTTFYISNELLERLLQRDRERLERRRQGG